MGKFEQYLQGIVRQKPEWANCYVNYLRLRQSVVEYALRFDASRPAERVALVTLNGANHEDHSVSMVHFREQFVTALLEEVSRFTAFFCGTLSKFEDHFTSKRGKWVAPGYDQRKARANVRFLFRETAFLREFYDANLLAVKKLVRKFNKQCAEAPLEEVHFTVGLAKPRQALWDLQDRLQSFYADQFDTDANTAQQELLPLVQPRVRLFRMGWFMGWIVPGLLYILHITAELHLPAAQLDLFWNVSPLYRLVGVLLLEFWCWGGILYAVQQSKINHTYILGLSPVKHLTWFHVLDISAVLTIGLLLSIILFLRSGIHQVYYVTSEFTWLQPYCPIAALVFLFCLLLLPVRTLHHTSRHTLASTVAHLVVLPFGRRVHFRDFFVADWLTSMTTSFADVMYTGCFYGNGDWRHSLAPECETFTSHWQFVVQWVPYFWRLCQCLKMFRLTKQHVHLINAGKYVTLMAAIFASGVAAHVKGTNGLYLAMKLLATTYAFVWDTLMDWGWIRGRARQRMFATWWVYPLGIALNFLGRYFFLLTYIGTWRGELKSWILLSVEVLRRAHWSVFRLENENCNNLEKYRSVDFVPVVDMEEYE